jgi:hypothetical protein
MKNLIFTLILLILKLLFLAVLSLIFVLVFGFFQTKQYLLASFLSLLLVFAAHELDFKDPPK